MSELNEVGTLVRWDWYKLARRKMPWVLLVIVLLLSQLAVWGNYFRYRNIENTGGNVVVGAEAGGPRGRTEVNCKSLLAGDTSAIPAGTSQDVINGLKAQCQQLAAQNQTRLRDLYDGFTLPGSIPNALGVAVTLGLLLLAILASSVIGAEYGWGTIRPILVRGTGRWPYLLAKMLLLILLAAAMLVVVSGVTAISSTIAKGLVHNPVAGTPTTWSHVAALLGRSWLALIPYVVLAVFVTVLTRSSATGMAIGITYYLAEQIIVNILEGIFSWFSTVGNYLLGENLATFAGVSVIGTHAAVSTLHAFLVLLVYAIVLAGIAFAVFRSRDITGANAS